MDNRNDIREFLSSRRARIIPEMSGLPVYGGNRRVPGLRREEVALLAGVSVDYYTRLERGNLGGVSEGVLNALARALQLDEAEREHLFDLARATTSRARRKAAPQRIRPGLQRLLDSISDPAWVRNWRLVRMDNKDDHARNPGAPLAYEYRWNTDRWETSGEYPYFCDRNDPSSAVPNAPTTGSRTLTAASSESAPSSSMEPDAQVRDQAPIWCRYP